MDKILEIKNLNFSYADKVIFESFNMFVENGTFVTIAGNNGSGKTTLINLICGILDCKNTIILKFAYINSARIRDNSRVLGVVLSSFNNKFLFDNVYKEMAYPLENLSVKPKLIEEKIVKIAKEFGITKLLDKKIEDLTNNEKSILLIATGLIHEPRLLLLDNSLSSLDPDTKSKVISILKKRVKEDGLSILLTTNNLEDIIDSDYTYIINKGNIIMEGIPELILKEDRILNRVGLELPFMVDLSLKLEFYELTEGLTYNLDRMVNKLWK